MSPGASQVFIDQCRQELIKLWDEIQGVAIDKNFVSDATISRSIEAILRSSTKTYRYVLPTQILAKLVNQSLDSRCLQSQCAFEGSFDARSLCHKVIVPFERNINSPLGGSKEPYVNNPVRVPSVTLEYLGQQKNKAHWRLMCEILDVVESSSLLELRKIYKQVLIQTRRLSEELQLEYPFPQRINHKDLDNLLLEFLTTPSGGARLQAVIYALFLTFKDFWDLYEVVKSDPVNAPDSQRGGAADVECLNDGVVVLAVEVKDRTITLEMIEDKINAARLHNINEVLFLARADNLIATEDTETIQDRISTSFKGGLNIYTLDAIDFIAISGSLLGEQGRIIFLKNIARAMDELRNSFADKKDFLELLKTV